MKEERSKEKLKEVYEKPIWNELRDQIDNLAKSFLKKEEQGPEETDENETVEEEKEVFLDNKFYGRCPQCHESFNYDSSDIGRLVRCRNCHTPLRLRRSDRSKWGLPSR